LTETPGVCQTPAHHYIPLLADETPPSYANSEAYDVQAEIAHWVMTANPPIQGIEDIEETIAHLVTLASVSPPKLPLSVIICGVCDSHDHHTPDYSQYICYECNEVIIPQIVSTNYPLSILFLALLVLIIRIFMLTLIVLLIEVSSILQRGLCYDHSVFTCHMHVFLFVSFSLLL
jgi:hypothetical protein